MRRGQTAVSLLETVIALFLLLGAFTFLAQMYRQSFTYLKQTQREAEANLFAGNVLNELRGWARTPANYQDPLWTSWASVTNSLFPDFEARVKKSARPTLVPCWSIEQQVINPADRVLMSSALVRAQVEVLWRGQLLHTLDTTIAEPERLVRVVNPVVVTAQTAVPSPLPRDQEVEFVAQLVDGSGQPINDVEFSWSVEAGTGNATFSNQSRDTRSATLKNAYLTRGGVTYYTGGSCRVQAKARYFGIEYVGQTANIGLQP